MLATQAAGIAQSLTALHFDDNADVAIGQLRNLAFFSSLCTLTLARTTSDTSTKASSEDEDIHSNSFIMADTESKLTAANMPIVAASILCASPCALDRSGYVAAAAESLCRLRKLERVVLTHGDAFGDAAAAALACLPASRCRVTAVCGAPRRGGEAEASIRSPWPPTWLVGSRPVLLDGKVPRHRGSSGGGGGAARGGTVDVGCPLHPAVTL